MSEKEKIKTLESEPRLRPRELEKYINSMAIRCLALEYENTRLRQLLYKSWRNKGQIDPEEIVRYELEPMLLEEAMNILQQPIEAFEFPTRIINCLCCVDIFTIKDLLYEIKTFDMLHLKHLRNFGTKSYNDVIIVLRNHNIIDYKNNSYLFEFI